MLLSLLSLLLAGQVLAEPPPTQTTAEPGLFPTARRPEPYPACSLVEAGRVAGPGVELTTSSHILSPGRYIRVTLKSEVAVRGFVLRAVGEGGTGAGRWFLPCPSSAPGCPALLNCSTPGDAVTHQPGAAPAFVLAFQWRADCPDRVRHRPLLLCIRLTTEY